jgi:hypothetical protein
MRNLLICLLLLSFSASLNAQYYTFTRSTDTYQDLSGSTNLFSGNWDDEIDSFELPFNFWFFGGLKSKFYVMADGYLFIPHGWDYGFITAITADLRKHPVLSSSVSYVIDGSAPNRIAKFQWKNAGYDGGLITHFTNYQIWIYENSSAIELRYGTSVGYNSDYFYQDAPFAGIGVDMFNLYVLEGNPANPVLDSNKFATLTSIPASGTVYRFDFVAGSKKLVKIQSPDLGDILVSNDEEYIQWTGSMIPEVIIDYTYDGGVTWNIIDSNALGSNSYKWIVPNTYSTQCLVRVTDKSDTSLSITSNGFFSIVKESPGTLNIYSPYNGQTFYASDYLTVSFFVNKVTKAEVLLSTDSGKTWVVIDTLNNLYDGYNYDMIQLSNVVSDYCKIWMRSLNPADINAYNDGFFRILAAPDPYIMIYSPFSGDKVYAEKVCSINYNVYPNVAVDIYYSIDNGTTWNLIIANYGQNFQYYWNVPKITSNNCFIKITASSMPQISTISGKFSIVAAPPALTLTNPNGYETWFVGTKRTITWSYFDVYSINLNYSTDSGKTWKLIGRNIESYLGSYEWTVPNDRSTKCFIKISNSYNLQEFDVNDNTFTIDWPTGVRNNRFEEINLFPNPSKDEIFIEIPVLEEKAKLLISDVHGRIVFQQMIDSQEYNSTINVKHQLSSGIYIVMLKGTGNFFTKKLVVE